MADRLKSNTLRLRCPHCAKELIVGFSTEPVVKARGRTGPKKSGMVRMGPRAYNPGPDVDDLIIRKGADITYTELAELLNSLGIPSARGGKWERTQARRAYHYALARRAESEAKEKE